MLAYLANEEKAFQDYLVGTMSIARTNKMYGRMKRLEALGRRNERKAMAKARRARRAEKRAERARDGARHKRTPNATAWSSSTRVLKPLPKVSIFYTKEEADEFDDFVRDARAAAAARRVARDEEEAVQAAARPSTADPVTVTGEAELGLDRTSETLPDLSALQQVLDAMTGGEYSAGVWYQNHASVSCD